MARKGRADLATRRAERLVRDEGIRALPVDPIALAEARGIEVVAKPAEAAGVSGMLIRIPRASRDDFVIAYSTHIDNEGFKRFSVAYELGHYVLDGHCDHLVGSVDTIHYSRAGFASGDRYEFEADHFAAGLLMPSSLFVPAMGRAGSGFRAIQSLAERCITSLTATAIRYASLSDEAVAIVMSTGDRVDYWFASETFKRIRGIEWLRKGDLLPAGSSTHEFNRDPERVARSERWDQSTTVREWFGDGPERELAEDVVGLGSYGKTLTVLFAEDGWPDEEEEEEEDSGASNPTFHRSRRR